MKHIKLFEKFKEFDESSLKDDINGILVELEDKGFKITISKFKTMGRDTISIVLMPLNQDGTVLAGFIIDDIDSYILTLVDYMKYKLGSDIYIEYLYWDIEYGGFKILDFSDKNKKTDALKINFCEERVTGNSKW